MVPWLLREGDTTVAAIAARFDLDKADVIRDLGIVGLCGVPPYGPDDLVDVIVHDDGTVTAFGQRFFDRPLMLSPAEGFAVLAAGRTLMEVGADDALAGALDKLEGALGASGALGVDLDAPPLLDVVRSAAEACRTLEVDYHTASRDQVGRRRIDPLLVHTMDGRWYVEAFDHESNTDRRFRIDRLLSASMTDDTFVSRPVEQPDSVYTPGEEAVRVTVAVPPSGRWAIEAYPARDVDELADGRLRATFDVVGDTWLGRLLLKLGPGAEVLDPAELVGAGPAAARSLLARYEAEPSR